jgi:hypothetical protein
MRLRLLVVAFVVAGLVGVAWGKPRTAVIGDKAIVAAVKKEIAKKVELVSVPVDSRAAPSELAADHKLNAVLVVTARGKERASVVVFQGADGAELDKLDVKASKRKLAKTVGDRVWKQLGKAIAKAKAPAGDTPVAAAPVDSPVLPEKPAPAPEKPVAAETPVAAPKSVAKVDDAPKPEKSEERDDVRAIESIGVKSETSGGGSSKMARLDIAVEGRPFWRRYRYNDDLDARLRPFDLVANAVGVFASYRPLKNMPGFAVQGGGELAVGVNGSRTPDMMEYPTSTLEWNAGVGYRFHIKSLRFGLAAAFGEHRFNIDDDMAAMGELIPDTTYRYLRGGLDALVPLDKRWKLTFAGGYRFLVGTGDLDDAAWFPHSSGAGLDFAAGADLVVTRWLRFYGRVDMRRYFFSMNPEPGDPWIAGGAVDQYLGAALGFAISAL